jgi:hypothetical protein
LNDARAVRWQFTFVRKKDRVIANNLMLSTAGNKSTFQAVDSMCKKMNDSLWPEQINYLVIALLPIFAAIRHVCPRFAPVLSE